MYMMHMDTLDMITEKYAENLRAFDSARPMEAMCGPLTVSEISSQKPKGLCKAYKRHFNGR
jgi:hypothetical protein